MPLVRNISNRTNNEHITRADTARMILPSLIYDLINDGLFCVKYFDKNFNVPES